jgi:F0F1-type ATP synthase membrane subunit b/b'
MNWMIAAGLFLLLIIAYRVTDCLAVLREISHRVESNRLEIDALKSTIAYQGEQIQKRISAGQRER